MTMTRFYPIRQDQSYYEHMHRYAFAKQFVCGKNVLDISCGEGYGTRLLADAAEKIVGCDLDDEIVKKANEKYQLPNLEYRPMDCQKMTFADKSFECITSFETIEHLPKPMEFLDEVKRVLQDQGLFIVSTPDKVEYSDKRNYHNEEHIHEFTREEFVSTLKKYFKNVRIIGQVFAAGSFLWNGEMKKNTYQINSSAGEFFPAMYMIAVCSDNEINVDVHDQAEIFTDLHVNDEFETCKAGIHELEKQLQVSKSGLDDLKKQLQISKNGSDDLKNQLQISKNGADDLKKQLAVAKSGIDDLKEQLNIAKNGIDDLKQQLLAFTKK